MPIYEYGCLDCRRKVSLWWRSFKAAENEKPQCPYCESTRLVRQMSRIGRVQSKLSDAADMPDFDDVDERNPKSLARMMRRLSAESGEDIPQEFDEVLNRLEKGQSPDEIEAAMPDSEPGAGNELNDFSATGNYLD